MTFAMEIARITYAPTEAEATGFLPPLMRAMGHILFALAAHSDPDTTLPDEALLAELQHAKGHWNAIYHNQALSDAADTSVRAYGDALAEALVEFENWDENTRSTNLRLLVNSAVGLGASLDRELVGLYNSNPGYTL